MTRLSLALAGTFILSITALASAQSYLQPYAPQSMSAGGEMPGQYNPAMMQPGGYPPAMMQPPAGFGPQSQYGDPMQPGHMAIPPQQPHMKLPPGVSAENGLLFYNGRAYADQNSSQAMGYNPFRLASYQDSAGGPAANMIQQPIYDNGGPSYGGQMSMGDPGPCGDDGGGYDIDGRRIHRQSWFPGKLGYCWTAGWDAIEMTRDTHMNKTLVLDSNTGFPLLNSDSFVMDPVAGGKTWLQLMGPSGDVYQLVYFKLASFTADLTVFGENNLQIPFPLAGNTVDWFGADVMSLHYVSSIQGGEVNFLRPVGNFQMLVGYRYMEIDESVIWTTIDNDGGTFSNWTVDCFNSMHMAQIGIVGQWQAFGLVNFDFWAKYGIGADEVSTRMVMNDNGNSTVLTPPTGVGRDSGFTSVAEFGIQAVIPLNATFSLHGGYDVFFINRVALAPDQFTFSTTDGAGTHPDLRGDIFMHGANVGITAVW
jgi:hypothetical protein